MNNDLISRAYLLNKFNTRNCHEFVRLYYVSSVIDHAPTVEPFEPDYVGAERLKARQRGYAEGYHKGMKIGKTLNPKIKQGEWKHKGGDEWVCSGCGHVITTEGSWEHPLSIGAYYCEHCGKGMQKEE